MAKIRGFTLGTGFTFRISQYEMQKPQFSVDVELDEGDDFADEVGKTIDLVNSVILAITESETPEPSTRAA